LPPRLEIEGSIIEEKKEKNRKRRKRRAKKEEVAICQALWMKYLESADEWPYIVALSRYFIPNSPCSFPSFLHPSFSSFIPFLSLPFPSFPFLPSTMHDGGAGRAMRMHGFLPPSLPSFLHLLSFTFFPSFLPSFHGSVDDVVLIPRYLL
jgi:hypothetical protein